MPKLFLSHEEAVAVALYVMMSKAAIEYERLPGGQLRITIDQNGAALLNGKSTPSYVYVQEGGSMSELYLHEYETEIGALAGRVNCHQVGHIGRVQSSKYPPAFGHWETFFMLQRKPSSERFRAWFSGENVTAA